MNASTRLALAALLTLAWLAPPPAAAAVKTTVICKDGTTDEGGRGACSGHGGIDKAATAKAEAKAAADEKAAKAEAKKEKAKAEKEKAAAEKEKAKAEKAKAVKETEKADPAKGPPTARCKDGSLSYAEHHTGACSRHGGVAEWLDKK